MSNPLIFDLHSLDGISCADLNAARLGAIAASAQARRWDVIPVASWRPGIKAEELRRELSEVTQTKSSIFGLGLKFESVPQRKDVDDLVALSRIGLCQIQVQERVLLPPDGHHADATYFLERCCDEKLTVLFNTVREWRVDDRIRAFSIFAERWQRRMQAVFRYSDALAIQDALCQLASRGRAIVCLDLRVHAEQAAAFIRRIGLNTVIVGIPYDEIETVTIPSDEQLNDDNIWDIIAAQGHRGLLVRLRQANFTEAAIELMTSDVPRRTFGWSASIDKRRVAEGM